MAGSDFLQSIKHKDYQGLTQITDTNIERGKYISNLESIRTRSKFAFLLIIAALAVSNPTNGETAEDLDSGIPKSELSPEITSSSLFSIEIKDGRILVRLKPEFIKTIQDPTMTLFYQQEGDNEDEPTIYEYDMIQPFDSDKNWVAFPLDIKAGTVATLTVSGIDRNSEKAISQQHMFTAFGQTLVASEEMVAN